MRTTTRKGLPLPDITDVGGSTYPIGVGIRATTTTGVVRDVQDSLPTLLDGFTDYLVDEQIAARWEFQGPVITDRGLGQLFVNNTGADRVLGDVVILNPAVDSSIIIPTAATAGGKVGVVAESIPSGSVGRVAFSGFIRVKVAGGTGRLGYLQTQNASVIATSNALAIPGTFAMAVTVPDGSSTVLACLDEFSTIEGGGTIQTGGLTINAGNLTVVGNGQFTTVTVSGALSGATQLGISVSPTFSNASSSANAISISSVTVNGFTTPFFAQLRLQSPGFGASQSITNFYNVYVDPVTAPAGTVNAYTLYLYGPTGAATTNTALYVVSGGVTIAAGGLSVQGAGNTINFTGANLIGFTVGGGSFASPSITGTVTGSATYNGIHLTSPVIDSGGLSITTGDLTIVAGRLLYTTAASQLIPGATNFSLRNNANNADNVLVTDAGGVTIRTSLAVTTTIASGDITTSRTASTGYLFLGSNGTHYVGFDGANYQMPAGGLIVSGGISATGASTIVGPLSGLTSVSAVNLTLSGTSSFAGNVLITGGGLSFSSSSPTGLPNPGVGFGGQHGTGNGATVTLGQMVGTGSLGPSVSSAQWQWVQCALDGAFGYIPIWR